MDASQALLDNGNTIVAGPHNDPFRLRSYQAEMVEESLKNNIIVVMDTGSGKTHIAVARAAVELETCLPDQLVWFLAPTITLCEQQCRVFETHLPAFGVRVLSGRDNVDHWSDQRVWDDALRNIRIVLSTHQVLLDALTHAFIKLSQLALMIFDEAHHCTLNHPASRIMKNFYKPAALRGNTRLPRILGLSASPVMRAKATKINLQTIERNLSAIAKTPKIHRSELITHVHKPELIKFEYSVSPQNQSPILLNKIRQAYLSYDLMSDPYVLSLLEGRARGDEEAAVALQDVVISQDTYCRKQLKMFSDRAQSMLVELGYSPADWYLRHCISKYEKMFEGAYHHQFFGWSDEEKSRLYSILQALHRADDQETNKFGEINMSLDHISPKAQALIDVLVSEFCSDFTGLVFVEQRVWIAALAEILATHPETKWRFNIGTFVGTSNTTSRRSNLADLAELQNTSETLDDFKAGKKNLILATSVLEEGIDISSCNLVICFERPKNLKSFIQRRGRARKEKSKYVILVPESSDLHSPELWLELEEEMKRVYLDDLREVTSAEEKEMISEDASMVYEVPSTGALLTLDNASEHLHHFCAVVGSSPYVDNRPQFSFSSSEGAVTAEVTLPISVHPDLRKAKSDLSWKTEHMAKKDAAFQAYKRLHLAGLVNDHLLPLLEDHNETQEPYPSDRAPSLIEVSPPYDPWGKILWVQELEQQTYHQVLLTLSAQGEQSLYMVFLTATQMPYVPPITLYWNQTRIFTVSGVPLAPKVLSDIELATLRRITKRLLCSALHSVSQDREDFMWLFVPSDNQGNWDIDMLHKWEQTTQGTQSALDFIAQRESSTTTDAGWVWHMEDNRKFILKGVTSEAGDPRSPESNEIQLVVIRVPRRRDFLHEIPSSHVNNDAYTRVERVLAARCRIDLLPSSHSTFALFIPSILYRYGIFLSVEHLRSTTLKNVTMNPNRLGLLVTALTASSTNESEDYQRLEFLGDCILKFLVCIHITASNPTWPESLLSAKKDKLVSNGCLARATMKAGLDRFIITKRFTGQKWQPKYVANVLSVGSPTEKTFRSSKILADVVESLIGASFLEGGFTNARKCMEALLPLEEWTSLDDANHKLFNAAPEDTVYNLADAETLIGYTFDKKTLLQEALTQASYLGPMANCSYERLEFLGDAVLDYIIVKHLWEHNQPLSHQTMHTVRTAMVNAAFLAFRMFETTIPQERINITVIDPAIDETASETNVVHVALWQFLRHSSPQIIACQSAAKARHDKSREALIDAFENGDSYPWHIFAVSEAEKVHSDIVESVLGAIYVDSIGDISECEAFIRKLGILDCLERILRDGVNCTHPKERLGVLAGERKVDYVNEAPTADNPQWKSRVKVGGEWIGSVSEGPNKLAAETISALKAIRVIEGIDDVAMHDDDDIK